MTKYCIPTGRTLDVGNSSIYILCMYMEDVLEDEHNKFSTIHKMSACI